MYLAPMEFGVAIKFLTEVNPQANDGGEEQKAKDDVDAALGWGLMCRLAHRRAYGNGFHFFVDRGKGESGQAFAVGGRGHQAYGDEDRRTDHEHENGVMQEVHIDQPADRRRLEVATAGAVGELKNEACRAQYKTGQERGDGAGAVKPGPEDSENKARGDRRTDVGLNALQINVELAADVPDERNPKEAEENHHAGGDAAEIDELLLRGLRTNLLIEIQGHEGGSGIENRAHGTHYCRKQGGHHQANETDREEVEDEGWIGEVRFLDLVGEKREGDDARQNEHEDGQNFQEAGKNRACLGVALVARGEHALHDDLVGTPIPDAENWRAKKDAGPWKVWIGDRFDHVEVVGRDHSAEMFETSDAAQTDNRECDRAGDEDQSLNGVGINDRGQAAGDGVNPCSDDQNYGGLPQRPAGDTFEDHAGGIELHGDFGEDVGDDGDRREIHSRLSIEAPLQKFGHGENIAAQVEGHENPAKNQQDQARQPLKMAHGQSG